VPGTSRPPRPPEPVEPGAWTGRNETAR
jgi:hypothetical protein